MSTAKPNGDYATQERLAIYLEIGWSDFLLDRRHGASSEGSPGYPNPLVDYVPPSFPLSVAGLAREWATETELEVQRYGDVGGAVGRTVYEMNRLFPALRHLTLVEPSTTFCDWARWLLATDAALPDIPLVDKTGLPRWVRPKGRPRPLTRTDTRLLICNETLESHDPAEGYDLLTCLNVIDRHPCPTDVVANIERLMADGGLLVMSCPFDFHEESTPDRAAWIDDLNVLFESRALWGHVGEAELYYEFRGHKRSWTRFAAQVVCKRWRAQS